MFRSVFGRLRNRPRWVYDLVMSASNSTYPHCQREGGTWYNAETGQELEVLTFEEMMKRYTTKQDSSGSGEW